jgi:type I restriction enzyme S subunit
LNQDRFFLIGRGEISNRLDAFFWQPKFHAIDLLFNRHPKWTYRLGAIAHGLTNGDHGGVQYTETGVRYLRGQSVTEFGLDLDKDTKFISCEDHVRMRRAEVISGDVLYTIAGSIGNACVIEGVERANINQAIVKIRPSEQISAQYLADFLNSSLGKLQSRRIANGGVQLNINFSEVKSQRILVPPPEAQHALVWELNSAKHAYKESLARADTLLDSIDGYLLSILGIKLPPEPDNNIANRIFTVKRRELGQRIDPAYFSFKFSRIQHALEAIPHMRLRDAVLFSTEQWDQGNDFGDAFPYLEISAIDTQTGEVSSVDSVPLCDAPSRARLFIRRGDILVSTTRPNRGAITLIGVEFQTPVIASTGFSVIRHVDQSKVSKDFLLILLRSQLCRLQLEQRSSGGNYPAITQSELGRVLLPSVAPAIQQQVVSHVKGLHAEAKHLRQQAKTELESAKIRIESMLLGGAA